MVHNLFVSRFTGKNIAVKRKRQEVGIGWRGVKGGGSWSKKNIKVRWKGESGRGSLALSNNLIPVGVVTAWEPLIRAFKGRRCHIRCVERKICKAEVKTMMLLKLSLHQPTAQALCVLL